jgi:hypothetical protein
VIVAEIGVDMKRFPTVAPDMVGEPMPGPQPERGQGEIVDLARWRTVAQNRAAAIGSGR